MRDLSTRELLRRVRQSLDLNAIRLEDWTAVKLNADGQVTATMQLSRENIRRLLLKAAEEGLVQLRTA
jgi:predicted DNA-binding protein (UPF0251 family)